MKKLTLILLITLISVLISRVAWSLPDCTGKYSPSNWHNCWGSYTWTKKSQFQGDNYTGEHWKGKMQGFGTYTYGKKSQFAGDIYVGQFRNDKRDGQGTYYFSMKSQFAGDKYEGEWKNNMMHGKGTYTWQNGEKLSGTFKYGKFIN